MSTPKVIRTVPEVGIRMRRDEYEKFEQMFGPPMLNPGASETEASFKLGVQYVLQMLRHGIY